jgi:hypothetical protein
MQQLINVDCISLTASLLALGKSLYTVKLFQTLVEYSLFYCISLAASYLRRSNHCNHITVKMYWLFVHHAAAADILWFTASL